MIGVIVLWFVNLVISYLNAVGAGSTWQATEAHGGFVRLLNWCAAIMSACGFTWCYSLLAIGVACYAGELTPEQALVGIQLGYVLVIPAVIGTGFVIMVHSWVRWWREGGVGNALNAGWNTYAQVSNMADAVSFFPEALANVMGGGSSRSAERDDDDDDAKGKLVMLAVVLVVMSLFLGILTTRYLVVSSASRS